MSRQPAATDAAKTQPSPSSAVDTHVGLGTDSSSGVPLAMLAALCMGTSPIFARWASITLGAYEITAARMVVAALLVGGLALLRGERFPRRADWPRFVLFGLIAALHFAFYIASLDFTTIAHSLALVYTAPIFVALSARWFLGEPLRGKQWIGVAIAILGIGVLAGFEPQWSRRMAIGDLLAVGSAITFGFYSVAGRSQRNRYTLYAYASSVYGLAALWLLPVALLALSPTGYTLPAVESLLALGAIPLALGHTLYNAALRRTNATLVNIITAQEVTVGVALGALLLSEMPSASALVGATITLLGTALVMRTS